MQSLNDRLQTVGELLIMKERLGEGKYFVGKMIRLDNVAKIKI
jgi:hypothetical protein